MKHMLRVRSVYILADCVLVGSVHAAYHERMGSKGDHGSEGEDRGTDPVGGVGKETQRAIPQNPFRPRGQSVPVLLLAYTNGRLGRGEVQPLFEESSVLGRDTLRFGGQELSDPQMSRRHAMLRREGDRWLLEDLNSFNGTYVDGVQIRSAQELARGDVVRMGNTLLVFSERPGGGYLPPSIPDLIGESPVMMAVREAVVEAARHAHNVLVTGETGVGKEVVARGIYSCSGRSGPFVAVNCAGLSKGVLESQLFGHVRGSFTGAVTTQEGFFQAAHGGMLLLDELGEMPIELQAKLLRAIETRTIQLVGAVREHPIDVRIVAATNCDVAAAVREGRLRADLYARLAQWPIEIPPLRERRDDLPLLIPYLLTRLGVAGRLAEISFVEALYLHPWPLNVRGLLNVLTIAARVTPAEQPLALHPKVERALEVERAMNLPRDPAAAEPGTAPASTRPRPRRGSVPERAVVEDALRRNGGNIAEAARDLECTRQQLYRWIKMYELPR